MSIINMYNIAMDAMTKLTVFGATGRTGRQVLVQGAERGLEITAFTRRPELLLTIAALQAVVEGDGRNPAAVSRAVDGADGVILIINGGGRRDPHLATNVARTVVAAMTEHRVRRLLVTSAYPIVGDRPRLPMTMLRLLLATQYADVATMEDVVSHSGLDWTIVRLNRLTSRPANGRFEVSRELFARPRAISRADVAAVLLDAIADPALARTALNVSGG
jgi:putative NADH-flavin reductase